MPSRQLPMSLIGSRTFEDLFDTNPNFYKILKEREPKMYSPQATMVLDIETGLIHNESRPAVQVITQMMQAQRAGTFTGAGKAVYALVQVVEPEKDLTDYRDGYYCWTNAEGVRRRIRDLDSEHLRGILDMPDFKNSRLTKEMRRAIASELIQRDKPVSRFPNE